MVRKLLAYFLVASACALRAQPVSGTSIPLSQIKAGQKGEVWTVFQGTQPEPFTVEVTGVILNAVGPGKSLILCKLTDPRVQGMGAVAGMSGSPLYIDGKFAGALSYQVQQFETTRYAGFTPAADMAEVEDRVDMQPADDSGAAAKPLAGTQAQQGFQSMRPVFALGGVSPATAAIVAPQFESLGISVVALAGSSQGSPSGPALPPDAALPLLRPGDAVSVALATGDISLAGTGTVSRVDGNRIVAFGHPMLGLGDVQFPMCAADIVAILPSSLQSVKVANVGAVIGSISQDRLSAVSGLLGPGPDMIDVEVTTGRQGQAGRTLRLQTVRDRRIAALIMLSGVVEGIQSSNDGAMGEGFHIRTTVTFSPSRVISRDTVYDGQRGFMAGMSEFLMALSSELQNPFEKAVPKSVAFHIEPMDENPAATIEQFQVSRTSVRPGETFQVTLGWRNFQGSEETATLTVPVDPSWAGKNVEVILAPGRVLDELTGHTHFFRAGQLRSFDAYIDALKGGRPEDGLSLAVVEKSALFFDQESASPDVPASIQRIESASDSTRYERRDLLVSLWETRVLEGKVVVSDFHKTVHVEE
jgi:hypothetical protein